MPREKLEKLYKKEQNPRKKERLQFILELYDGQQIKTSTRMIRRSYRTARRWLQGWNKEGLQGLMPVFAKSGEGGGNPYLDKAIWMQTIEDIKNRGMSIEDTRKYINKKYEVSYSYNGVWDRLRKKKNGVRPVHYGKPFKMHVKRPPDAELILKKSSKKQE